MVIVVLLTLPVLGRASDAPPKKSAPNEPRHVTLGRRLTAEIKVGMTFAQAVSIVDTHRPAWHCTDGNMEVVEENKPRLIYASRALGAGVRLLIESEKTGVDNAGKPAPIVTAVKLASIDDLRNRIGADVFGLVRAVHLAPKSDNCEFDPAALVRAVNVLQAVGKDKAIRALRAYETLADKNLPDVDEKQRIFLWRHDLAASRVEMIGGLLFEPIEPRRSAPGSRNPNANPNAPRSRIELLHEAFPAFPVVLSDDLPFYVSFRQRFGWSGTGAPIDVGVTFYEKKCRLRKAPLRPSSSPFAAAAKLSKLPLWNTLYLTQSESNWLTNSICEQSLAAVEPLLDDQELQVFVSVEKNNENQQWYKQWVKTGKRMEGRGITWSKMQSRFEFAK